MRVYITRTLPEAGIEILKEAGIEIAQYSETKELDKDEFIKTCQDFDALLIAGHVRLDEYFFSKCPHLKAVSLLSVGYDNVDINAATKYKIPVGHTPDVLSGATADTAFLLMLAASRKAFYMYDYIKQDKWHFYQPTANLGIELNNKTLGIFGMGRIGMEMAKKAKGAYNMSIIYHNRKQNNEAEQLLNARYVSFEELLEQSDVLSAHANLSEETKGIFNKEAFAKMKPSSIFINTARGALHNETDLTEAIQKGIIWGAGLDVTNPEPMSKDNILLTMPTVCVLPHQGSATIETRAAMAKLSAENIVAIANGKEMPHTVNKDVYAIQK
ncbi:MAG: D-glycerate dehydrogenase [Arachidicoccus sp.]|nr:D-glycerate dehydrogenase [Arachidicoccus sp.]